MAAPAWATNMTDFWVTATGATTVTALGGGGSALSNPETDYYIETSSCISKGAWTNAIKGFIVDALGTTFTVPTDGAIILYAKYDAAGSLAVVGSGGFQVIVGSGNGDYQHYYVGGSDTLAFDSWVSYAIDPNTATQDNTTGAPDGNERWVGILANLPTTSGPTKGNPIAIDAIRYGRIDIEYTAGDGTSGYNTFSGAEGYANASTRRWGVIRLSNGSYLIQGYHSLGTSGAAVDFRDSNKVLYWKKSGENNLTRDSVSSNFNKIEILNASSNVDWDNITIQALGNTAKGVFVHTAGSFDATSCQFVDMNTFTFISTSTLTGCVFRRCGLVTIGTGTFTNCDFINSTASASCITADIDDLSGCYFESDGSNHAVELSAVGTGSASWSNTLSGYVAGTSGTNVSTSSTGNEAIYLNFSSAATFTINVAAGATIPSVRKGASFTGNVNVVAGAVTLTVKAVDAIGTNVSGARVLCETGSGATLPYQDSVSITRSGTTATVAHTAHGLNSGDEVVIRGVAENEYNGIKTISNVTTNAYDFTVTGTPATPATGTPVSSFVFINTTTDVNGEATYTATFTADQPLSGRVRKSSAPPYYKSASIVGTLDKDNGTTVTVVMLNDQ